MSKIFNKFLIGVLFLLGIIFIPTFKADATIAVTVKVDGQTSTKTITSGTTVTISWEAPVGTTCNSGGHGTGNTGSFYATPTATTTFSVSCTGPSWYVYGGPYTIEHQGETEYLVNICIGTDSTPYTAGTDSFDIRWEHYLNGDHTTQYMPLAIPTGSPCGEVGIGIYPTGQYLWWDNVCVTPPSNLNPMITIDPSFRC